jgi:polyhydroxyalkanoate synthase
MSTEETAWQAGESAASVLGPEADLFASADAAGLGVSTLAVLRRAARKPRATGTAALRYWTSLALAGPAATARWLGVDAPPPVPVPAGDKRFADPAWTANPAFFAVRRAHLAASRLVADVLAAGAGDQVDDAKAALAAGFLLDAAAPTNFLATNPAALKLAFETGGASVVAGAGHMVDDLLNNGDRPRQVDLRPFRVGENLATTAGKVVFRNDLMELIQYAPQTKQVRAVPVLASPPWINKYYVMDLAPGRSFLEWAIQHERTGSTVRYVLSSGGHIAGIVNPPGPKAWYEAGDYAGASPDTWRAAASKHKGSWWEDWTAWSDARAGAPVKPPPLGSKRHPALGDAPGEYVRG